VNTLERIHAALVPGGLLVDTQPVSPRPQVQTSDGTVGTLDMREWLETIEAVDRLVSQVIEDGLYGVNGEQSLWVADSFDDGAELVKEVSGWKGTRISQALSRRAAGASPPLRCARRCGFGS
jgi:hypothetical protein